MYIVFCLIMYDYVYIYIYYVYIYIYTYVLRVTSLMCNIF